MGDAPRVERHALADQAEHGGVGRAGGIVPKDDESGRLLAALGNAEQEPHLQLGDTTFVEYLDDETCSLRELDGLIGKGGGGEAVARLVG